MREWNIQHAGLYMAHYHSHPLRAGLVTKWGRSSLPKEIKQIFKTFSESFACAAFAQKMQEVYHQKEIQHTMKHLDLLKVSLNAWKEKRISQRWFDGDLHKK